MTPSDFQRFYNAYIEALYFTDTGEEDQPAGHLALHPDALASINELCHDFASLLEREGLLEDYLSQQSPEQLGHDLWLTRNGHGVGFWDRGLGTLGDTLSDLCRPYGECYVYEGDDGLIHIA